MSLEQSITAPADGQNPSAPVDLVTETSQTPDLSTATDSPISPTSPSATSPTASSPSQTAASKVPILTPAQTAGIAIGGIATAVLVFLFVAALASCWHRRKLQARAREQSYANDSRFGPPPPPSEKVAHSDEKNAGRTVVQDPQITASYPKMMEPDNIGVAVSSEKKTEITPISAESMESSDRPFPIQNGGAAASGPIQSYDATTVARPESVYTYIDEKRGSVSTIGNNRNSSAPTPISDVFGASIHAGARANTDRTMAPSLRVNIPPPTGSTGKLSIPMIKRQKPDRDSVSTLIAEDPMSPAFMKNGDKLSALHMLRPPRDAPFDYIPSYYYTQQPGMPPVPSPGPNATFGMNAPYPSDATGHGLNGLISPSSTSTTLVNPITPPPAKLLHTLQTSTALNSHAAAVPQYQPYRPGLAPPTAYRGTSGPPPRPVRSTPTPAPNTTTHYQQHTKRIPSNQGPDLVEPTQKNNRDSAASFTSIETSQSDGPQGSRPQQRPHNLPQPNPQPRKQTDRSSPPSKTSQPTPLTPVVESPSTTAPSATASTATSPTNTITTTTTNSNVRYPPPPALSSNPVHTTRTKLVKQNSKHKQKQKSQRKAKTESKWYLQEESPTRPGRDEYQRAHGEIEPPRPSPRQVIGRAQQQLQLQQQMEEQRGLMPAYPHLPPPTKQTTLPGPPPGPPPLPSASGFPHSRKTQTQGQGQAHIRGPSSSTSASTSTTTTSTLAHKRQGEPLASALQKQLWITGSNGKTGAVLPPPPPPALPGSPPVSDADPNANGNVSRGRNDGDGGNGGSQPAKQQNAGHPTRTSSRRRVHHAPVSSVPVHHQSQTQPQSYNLTTTASAPEPPQSTTTTTGHQEPREYDQLQTQEVFIPADIDVSNPHQTQKQMQLKSPLWEPRLTPRRGPGGDLVIEVT